MKMIINRLKLKIPKKIGRFLPAILSAIFIAIVFVSPLGAHGVEASWNPIKWVTGFPTPSDLVLGMFVGILNIVMWLASIVVWIAGLFFDLTLKISIIDFHKYANMAGITTGWTISRDIINIFFIFILLYIAIATILQIAGYGIKDLLVKVILIALLVNFSGVVTKVIIDASNVVAVEFYSKITAEADISSVLMQGLKLQTVYKSYDTPIVDSTPDPTDQGVPGGEQMSTSGLIVGMLGGTLLMLVTSFVLFAAGLLFLIRTITLLFLIILAPLAFAGMILPVTSAHSKKWWSTLFSQSFFAPAYMFMIYLVFMIISKNSLAEAIGMEEGAGLMDAVFKGSINTLVYFIILIGLMVGSLIVAKSMGAVGASTVMKWGDTARKWGQGYAGKKTKHGAGFIAEKTLSYANEKDKEGKFKNPKISGAMRRIPLAGRGLAKASSWREQQLKTKEDKYKKQYGSYSEAGLATASGIQDGLTARTLKEFGMKNVKGSAIGSVLEKKENERQAKERKRKNIENENRESEEIKGRMTNPLNPLKDKGTAELRGELVKIEAELAGLTNISAEAIKKDPSLQQTQDDINKKRTEFWVKKDVIKQEKEDRERLREIEENQERRIETEKIEERVSKVESSSGGKKEKSSPEKK